MNEELGIAEKQQEDAQQRKQKFEGLIAAIEQRALNASRTIAELDELKLRAEDTRNLLRALRDEISSIGMESKAPARVKLASPATVPLQPRSGRRLQMFILVSLFAMSMSFGTGFVLELVDQQVRSPEDVAAATSQPILAAIPHAGAEKIPKNQPLQTLAAEMPDTAIANEFRRLVARLAYSDIELVEINSCLVTSPTFGDGKTTVACNLALALAEANRRVLLIDTVPGHQVEQVFELETDRGLSEALFGGYDLRDVVRTTPFTGLFVLGPGVQPGNLSVKLASREMVELLEQCERHFDHVIIDSAPALLLSDAKCLAPIVDGVLLVVGTGKSRLGMIHRAVADLNLTGSTILGIVVNGIRPSWGGYLHSNLKLFHRHLDRQHTAKGNDVLPEMEIIDVETVDAP